MNETFEMEWLIAGTLISIGALASYTATKIFSSSSTSKEEVHTIIQNHIEAQSLRDNTHESFQNMIITSLVISFLLIILGVVFRFIYIGVRATMANTRQANTVHLQNV